MHHHYKSIGNVSIDNFSCRTQIGIEKVKIPINAKGMKCD